MPKKPRHLEISRAAEVGTHDPEGFRAPDTRGFDVVVRVREQSAFQVAVDELDRLAPRSAVIVWDETGVRTGKLNGLWAGQGSVTVAFVLPRLKNPGKAQITQRLQGAVTAVLKGFVDASRVSFHGDEIRIDEKQIGRLIRKSEQGSSRMSGSTFELTFERRRAPCEHERPSSATSARRPRRGRCTSCSRPSSSHGGSDGAWEAAKCRDTS